MRTDKIKQHQAWLGRLVAASTELWVRPTTELPPLGGLILCLVAEAGGSLDMVECRERLQLSQSRASRLCASLMEQGYIRLETGKDRRFAVVVLTPTGERLVVRVLEKMAERL